LLIFGGWVLPWSEILHQLFRPDPAWTHAALSPVASLLYLGIVPLLERLTELWPLWLIHSALLLVLGQLLPGARTASLLAALGTLFTAWHIAPAGISLGQIYPDAAWVVGIVLVWATYGWVTGERPAGTRAVEVPFLDHVVVLWSMVAVGLAAILYLAPSIGSLLAHV
jgi:hypothetical protein